MWDEKSETQEEKQTFFAEECRETPGGDLT